MRYAAIVKRLILSASLLALSVVEGLFLLGVPHLASARVWDGPVERPSRRLVREALREVDVRTPEMLTLREVSLDRTFESSEFGVKIQYPPSWERDDVLQSTPPLTLVVMFLSNEQRPTGIRQNINLVIEDLPSEMTLAEYTELGIAMERDFFENYTLLKSDDVTIAGTYRGHRVQFTAVLSGGAMTFKQVWILRGNKAHVWTFADSVEVFDEHVKTFERMLDTLTLH